LKSEKVNILVLCADSEPYPKRILIDTVIRGLLQVPYGTKVPEFITRFDKFNIFSRMLERHYDKLSYTQDWLEAIKENKTIKADICNINNIVDLGIKLKKLKEYDFIIILHSALGDDCRLLNFFSNYFNCRKCPLIAFIGNEYDLLPEKKELLKSLNTDYICTQLPLSVASWLYEDVVSARVIPMPHALNQKKYFDQNLERFNVLGFIGSLHPLWIGDNDRTCLFNRVNQLMIELDIRGLIDTTGHKLPSTDWAKFLNQSIGTIGAESGTYYLDKSGQLLMIAKEILRSNPTMDFAEIYGRVFESPALEVRSAKCISSRHFEPIGTKTCQLLLEGSYNDILMPDIHYIAINKDKSNLKDSINKIFDHDYRMQIVNTAYEYIIDTHTYSKRLEFLLQIVLK
jgi:hypothetical protein